MKLKIKIKFKHVFRYIYILMIMINLGLIYYTYGFYKENVYPSLTFNEDYIESRAKYNTGDINLDKFNRVIRKIEYQGDRAEISKNIFN